MDKKTLVTCFALALTLSGCHSNGLNKILYGGQTGDPKSPTDYPLRTVACCAPVGPTTAAFCARLLGAEGLHGSYAEGTAEHFIVEGGYFNFPLQSVCDTAMVK